MPKEDLIQLRSLLHDYVIVLSADVHSNSDTTKIEHAQEIIEDIENRVQY